MSASHGAVVLPAEAGDAAEALRVADGRLYGAKRARGEAEWMRLESPHVVLRALAERDPELRLHLEPLAAGAPDDTPPNPVPTRPAGA